MCEIVTNLACCRVASTEESERMLESDPRIVLRPLSHAEDA